MAKKTVALATKDDLDKKAEANGSNATGDWNIDITGNAKTATKATSADSAAKATQDASGNVITDTYLPFSGGTMDKGASIIVPYTANDDRCIEITGHDIKNYLPSNTGYAGGLSWHDQSENTLGSIGLYGSKGIPEYYFVGSYSDPFVKVDMEGNTTIKKKLTVNEDIQLHYTKGIYWREGTFGDQFKIIPTFGGENDSNMLLIQSAVGEKDTLPDLTTKISIAGKTGNTTFEGNIIGKSSLSISGTINSLTTKYVYKTENGGYPTYLLMFDVSSLYLGTSYSKWGFNGLIYSSRSNGYMGQEEVATIAMACAYQKSTTIGSTLRLTTNNSNYRPCIIHDTVNDKYYLSLKLSGQGRNLVFQGYAYNTMNITQINSTSSSGTLPDGYEFTFDPVNCTMGMGVSSSCSGNAATATSASNIANNLTTTVSGYSLDARQGAQLLQYMGGVYGNFGTELQSLTVSPEYGSVNAYLNFNDNMGNYKILEFDCYLTDAPQYMTTIRVPVDLFVYDKTITLCIQQQGQYMYCNAKKDSSYNIYYTFGGVSSGWSSYTKMSIRLRGLK